MIDLKHLCLTIELAGSEFDGCLNFGAVVLSLNGKSLPLDIIKTCGTPKSYRNGDSGYILTCYFEPDYSEVEHLYSLFEEFDFSLAIEDFLLDNKTQGEMNLILSDEVNLSADNINRIQSMVLKHAKCDNINIPIAHSLEW